VRIALAGPFAPFRGGIAQFNDRLRAELLSRGHEVTALTFSRQYPGVLFPGSTQYDTSRVGDAAAVLDSVNPISWFTTGRRIRRDAPDALVLAYWTPHLAPALAGVAAFAGGRSIGLIHNALPHDGSALSKPLARLFLGQMDAALTLSDSVASDLTSLGFKGQTRVAFHPVYDHFGVGLVKQEARNRLGLEGPGPVLLCLGLVRPYKGFDLALDAFADVLAAHPEATLVIAGEAYDGSLDDRLAAAPAAVRARVVRENRYIPDAEVPLYYSAADLLVLPYRSATQSGALAAAAHFGLPVVVSNLPGLAKPVREFEMGTVAGYSEGIAAAILEALAPDRHAVLSEGGRRMAREASWAKFAGELEKLIEAD
jgi:D-inositol-3-phosphate glycosyltransferase